MNEESETSPVIDSWDTYWAGAQSSSAFSGGGTTDPLVLSFWDEIFRDIRERRDDVRIIDIASGNGAVIDKSFGTTDVMVVLPISQISDRYINHYGADASRFAS